MTDEHETSHALRAATGSVKKRSGKAARVARSLTLRVSYKSARVFVAVGACVSLTACASRQPAPAATALPDDVRNRAMCLPKGSTAVAEGDWDDMYAAAVTGADQADCAIVRVNESTEEKWVAEILSVRDERGLLIAYRRPPACTNLGEEDGRIVLVCSLGIFGNADAEQRVLNETVQRLGDLYGVEFAPVR